MKKFFISAAIIAIAFSVSAQRTEGGNNLVVNGSFGAEGLKQIPHPEYTWFNCNKVVELPGWSIRTSAWNGGSEVMCDPILDAGDGDLRAEDDIHWFRFFSDNDNMWTAETIQQKMTGLVAGTTYNLEFVFCGAHATVGEGSDAWEQAVDMKVEVAEVDKDKDGNEILGKQIMEQNFKDDVEGDWKAANYTFTATASEMFIKFSFGGWLPDDKHSQAWMGLDNVDVYDPNGVNGVNDITVDNNAPVEYFNLQGVRVANPENGLFIRRQGSKVAKVAL